MFQEVHRLNGQLQSTQKHLKTEINSLKEKNSEHKTHLQQQGKELCYSLLFYILCVFGMSTDIGTVHISFLFFSLSLSLFSEVEIKRLQEEREQLIQELQQSKGTNKQNIISTVIIIIIIVELSTAKASHLESVQSDLTTTKQQLEVKTNNNWGRKNERKGEREIEREQIVYTIIIHH